MQEEPEQGKGKGKPKGGKAGKKPDQEDREEEVPMEVEDPVERLLQLADQLAFDDNERRLGRSMSASHHATTTRTSS